VTASESTVLPFALCGTKLRCNSKCLPGPARSELEGRTGSAEEKYAAIVNYLEDFLKTSLSRLTSDGGCGSCLEGDEVEEERAGIRGLKAESLDA